MYNLKRGDDVIVSKDRVAKYLEFDKKKRHHKIEINGKIKLCPNTPKKISYQEKQKYERRQQQKTGGDSWKEKYKVLEKNRDKYKSEYFRISDEVVSLKENVEELEKEVANLSRGNKSDAVAKFKKYYERKLQEKDVQIQKLDEELNEQIARLASQLQEKVGERDQSFNLAQDFEDQMEDMKKELKVKDEVIRTHESNLKKLKKHEKDYEELMEKLKSKVEKLRKENAALQVKNDNLETSPVNNQDIKAKDNLIEALQGEAEHLLKEMEVTDQKQKELQEENERIKQELESHTQKTAALEAQVAELQKAAASSSTNDGKMQMDVRMLKFEMSQKESQITRLKKDLDQMGLRHAREVSDLVKNNNDIQAKSESEIFRLKTKIEDLKDSHSKALALKENELSTARKMETDMKDMPLRVQQAEGRVKEMEARNASKDQENEILRAEQNRLKELKEKLEKDQKSSVEKASDLSKSLAGLQEANSRLMTEIKEKDKSIEEKAKENKAMNATISELRQSMRQKETQMVECNSQQSLLKVKTEELRKKEDAINAEKIKSEKALENKAAEIEKAAKQREESLKEREQSLESRENKISIEEANLTSRRSEVQMQVGERLNELQKREEELKKKEEKFQAEKADITASGHALVQDLETKNQELGDLKSKLQEKEMNLSQREESFSKLQVDEDRLKDLDERELDLNRRIAEFQKKLEAEGIPQMRESLEARKQEMDAQQAAINEKIEKIRKAETALKERNELQELDQTIKLAQSDFSSSVSAKQMEIEKKEQELAQKEKQLQVTQKAVSSMKAELEQEMLNMEKKKNELIDKGKILVQHEEQIDAKLQESMTQESLRKENEELNERVKSLTLQLSQSMDQAELLKLKEEKWNSRASEMQIKEQNLEKDKKESMAKLEKEKAQIVKMTEELRKQQDKLNQDRAEIQTSKEKLKQSGLRERENLQKERESLAQKVADLQEERVKFSKEKTEQHAREAFLMQQDEAAKKEKEGLQSQQSQLRLDKAAPKKETESSEDMHTVLLDLSKISTETQTHLQTWQTHLQNRQTEVSIKEKDLEQRESALLEKEKNMKELQALAKDSVSKMRDTSLKNSELEIAQERERVQSLQKEMELKNSEIENLKQEKAQIEKKHQADMDSMRDIFNDARKERNDLEDSVRRQSMEDCESTKKLRVKEEEVMVLEQQLSEKTQEAQDFREKYENAQMELVKMDTSQDVSRKRKLDFDDTESNAPKRVRLSPDAEWQEEKQQYQKSIASLRDEITHVKTYLQTGNVENASEVVDQVRSKFDSMQNELAQTKQKYQDIKQKYAHLESVKKEYEASEGERKDLSSDAEALRAEIAGLREEYQKREKMMLENDEKVKQIQKEDEEVRRQFGGEEIANFDRIQLMQKICTLRDELACANNFYKEKQSVKQEEVASPPRKSMSLRESMESDAEHPTLSKYLTSLLKLVCTEEVHDLNESLEDDQKNLLAIDIWDVLVCIGPQIGDQGTKLSDGKYLFFDSETLRCLQILEKTWRLAFVKTNNKKLLKEVLSAIDPEGTLSVSLLSNAELRKRERTSSKSKSITLLMSAPPKKREAQFELFLMSHYCLRTPLKDAVGEWSIPKNLGFRRATNMLQHLSFETQEDRISLFNNLWNVTNNILFRNCQFHITGIDPKRKPATKKKVEARLQQLVKFYGAEVVSDAEKSNYIIVVDELPRTMRKRHKAEVVSKHWIYACIDAFSRDPRLEDYRPKGFKKMPKSPGIFKRTRAQRKSLETAKS